MWTKPAGQAILQIPRKNEPKGTHAMLEGCNWGYDNYREELRALAKDDYFGSWVLKHWHVDELETEGVGSMDQCMGVIESHAPRFLGLLKFMTASEKANEYRKSPHVPGR